MRNRGLSTKDGVMPENPEWIVFTTSDGNSKRWPTNTTMNPEPDGSINFMDPLDLDSAPAIKWRSQCGAGIAEILNMTDYGALILCAAYAIEGIGADVPFVRLSGKIRSLMY